MKYKAAIIGCGNIFPMHGWSVHANPHCDLVAVADNKFDRAQAKAVEFGCKAYADYEEMILNEKPNGVHICTPHYLHAQMALFALGHNAHVLTEKPMAIDINDAEQMVAAAERAGKNLGVIFQNRYNPGSVFARQMLDSGELGRVKGAKMEVTWCRGGDYYADDWHGTWDKEGGGVIINQALHTFDLMRYLVGANAKSVDCHISNRAHPSVEVEDEADGVIVFDNGVMGSFYCNLYYANDDDIHLQLLCEKGKINIYADTAKVEFMNGRTYAAGATPGEFFAYGGVKSYWGMSHKKQIDNFYSCLANGERPFIDGHDALETTRMVLACYQSAKTNLRVTL
ncbi:MAG: Gfo/Idh/MocA family oxidoreductase [Clostridiales bacterium]|jgi:predicted dehydrogenase|nr:Gfo/Idh/MocA family oxidoreductase [Clostridiales bacterium]